jgi:hypothetical protein
MIIFRYAGQPFISSNGATYSHRNSGLSLHTLQQSHCRPRNNSHLRFRDPTFKLRPRTSGIGSDLQST